MNEKLCFDIIEVLMECEDCEELDNLIRFINNCRPILYERLKTVIAARNMGLSVGFVPLINEGGGSC